MLGHCGEKADWITPLAGSQLEVPEQFGFVAQCSVGRFEEEC